MKKLIASLLLASTMLLPAADTTFTIATGGAIGTNLVSSAAQINAVYLYNGGLNTISYWLYDSEDAALTYSSTTAFTNYISYLTNIEVITSNFFLVPQTNWHSNVLFTVPISVPGLTNTKRLLASGTILSSNTLTIPLSAPWYVGRGLTVSNSLSTNNTVRLVYTALP